MRPFHRTHEGCRVPPGVLEKPFREAIAYQPRDDDIFIVTYQKSGTHWASTIVNHILQGPTAKVPPNYLEMYGPDAVNECHRGVGLRNVIQSHLPVALLPWNPKARYVMVVRDPKDVLVSLFHHSRNIELYDYKDGTIEHFFNEFLAGRIEYGCYFRALLDYYWLSIRSPQNTLLLTYEGIHQDKFAVIKKIATFLGVEVTDERGNTHCYKLRRFFVGSTLIPQRFEVDFMPILYRFISTGVYLCCLTVLRFLVAVHQIIDESDIKKVRANCTTKYDSMSATNTANQRLVEAYTKDGKFVPPPPIAFARKGEVGDWKTHLTSQMAETLDARMAAMPEGVRDLWKHNPHGNEHMIIEQ